MHRTAFDERMDDLLGRIPPAVDPLDPNLHWLVRAAYAGILLFHGQAKLAGGSAVLAQVGALPVAPGLVGGLEVAAGLLLLLGGTGRAWATRLAGLAATPVLIGAIVLVHWPRWSFVATEARPLGGMEFPALMLALAVFFFVRGNRWA